MVGPKTEIYLYKKCFSDIRKFIQVLAEEDQEIVDHRYIWYIGSYAILLAWMHFMSLMSPYTPFVIMFGDIAKKIISIMIPFMASVIAFAFAFHALENKSTPVIFDLVRFIYPRGCERPSPI